MLRAEAAEFTPNFAGKDAPADCGASYEDASTVAPSPALTANCVSPMMSPFWGYEAIPEEMQQMWEAGMYGFMQDENGNMLSEFTLPDGQTDETFFADYAAYGRARADTEPSPTSGEGVEFSLEGLEEMQKSLASFLKTIDVHQEGDSQESTSAESVTSPPPGLAPPPGLELPPGLEDLEPMPPSMMEEEHKKVNPLPPGTTTAMFKNLPNKYSQKALVERLHEAGYKGDIDFIYLPIDFKNRCNVGYCFLNFRTEEACARFAMEYHLANSRDKLPGFNSKKVCEVSAARHQGRDDNVRRLQGSSVMPELLANPEWLPKLFNEKGEEIPFPMGKTYHNDAKQSKGKNRRATY